MNDKDRLMYNLSEELDEGINDLVIIAISSIIYMIILAIPFYLYW